MIDTNKLKELGFIEEPTYLYKEVGGKQIDL